MFSMQQHNTLTKFDDYLTLGPSVYTSQEFKKVKVRYANLVVGFENQSTAVALSTGIHFVEKTVLYYSEITEMKLRPLVQRHF